MERPQKEEKRKHKKESILVKSRKNLKPYEIDYNVIDLDAYLCYYGGVYPSKEDSIFNAVLNDEDVRIIFKPDNDSDIEYSYITFPFGEWFFNNRDEEYE